mgnify:CR=1 FL=1
MLERIQALEKALAGMSEEEKLSVLSALSRMTLEVEKAYSVIADLTDEQRYQVLAAYRAMLKPRRRPGPKPGRKKSKK